MAVKHVSGLVAATLLSLAGCVSQQQQQQQPPTCNPGYELDPNGSCVWIPPAGANFGSGATIYVWASASTATAATGKIYVMVNGGTTGEINGYATNGTPTCGYNAIYAVITTVAPGASYAVSAHDQETDTWAPINTPTMSPGACWSMQLN